MKKMRVSVAKTDDIYRNVMHCLEEDKVFLNPALSLFSFSVMVGTNTTYLSNAINEHCGCNFRMLINHYRVEYAKKMLVSNKYGLADLPKQCGFASRSAFYAAFQRVEGVSPLNYLTKKGGSNE